MLYPLLLEAVGIHLRTFAAFAKNSGFVFEAVVTCSNKCSVWWGKKICVNCSVCKQLINFMQVISSEKNGQAQLCVI